jgi:uncharacterized hydrophobic protein (TIGR00271 family)
MAGPEADPAASSPARALHLLHDGSLDLAALAAQVPDVPFSAVSWSGRETVPARARVLLYLGDEQVRGLASLALELQWEVGLLPHPAAHHACAALGVKGKLPDLLKHYLAAEAIEADLLNCNGELVFSNVVVGRVLALRPYDINLPQTRWSFFLGALKGLSRLRLSPYRITTGKERSIQLAAIGLLALNHTRSTLLGRNFSDDLSIADGRLSLLALAPRSILSYLWFILRLMWPGRIALANLPGAVALVQTDRLLLEAPRGCEYLLDGKPVHASEIEFRIVDGRLRLLPGPALAATGGEAVTSGKETVRLNHVPVNEAAVAMTGKTLPLFNHASEEEYRELFVALRDSSSVTPSYQVLMVLSVLLALSGLYADSAPVIIGAMILAPMMSPVVSLAMGLARSDVSLIRNSVRTVTIGMAWGLGCAVLMSLAMPLDVPTQEMRSRMSPTLLDLMVAVISGIAGAYANAKEEIAKSLAGVAIAVALVPPLCVAGIGLGWAEWELAWGAFLLLITNLVGIAAAASVTFLVLGFAPFGRARKGLVISIAMMLAISVPLSAAFMHLVERDRIQDQVPVGVVELLGEAVDVVKVQVTVGDPHLVRVVLSSSSRLHEDHVDALKQIVVERVGEPLVLEAQLDIRR